jgi:hypothetical protein
MTSLVGPLTYVRRMAKQISHSFLRLFSQLKREWAEFDRSESIYLGIPAAGDLK